MCLREEETLTHLFLYCDFDPRVWNYITSLLGLSFWLARRIDNWLTKGLKAWNLKGKAGAIGSCVFRALMWLLWKKRNSGSLEDK